MYNDALLHTYIHTYTHTYMPRERVRLLRWYVDVGWEREFYCINKEPKQILKRRVGTNDEKRD